MASLLPLGGPTRALVRPPGNSFRAAISSTAARIDPVLARRQHAEYCGALREAGVDVTVLEADERYPDACFMQDPALVLGGLAVIGRSGAASRTGEEETLAPLLAERFPIARIVAPGTLEGGDVMVLPDRVLVGASGRTNRAGIAQLALALSQRRGPDGAWVDPIPVVEELRVAGALHLLSVATTLGPDAILATPDYAGLPAFRGLEVVTAPDEPHAANVLAIRSFVIVPAENLTTAALLRSLGFTVLAVPVSEFAKADGGVTCLSLLW